MARAASQPRPGYWKQWKPFPFHSRRQSFSLFRIFRCAQLKRVRCQPMSLVCLALIQQLALYRDYAMQYIAPKDVTNPPTLVWIMVHDWSSCGVFYWNIWSMRWEKNDKTAPYLGNSHVLQTNGDTNSNCIDPARDVVIPPEYVFSSSY